MSLYGTQRPYDRDGDGRLDAGEWEMWEQGFQKPYPEPPEEEYEEDGGVTFTLEFTTDLIQSWETMKTALWAIAPSAAPQLQPMLGRAMIRAVIYGVSAASCRVDSEKWGQLDQFFRYADDLGAAWSVGTVLSQAGTGALPYPLESELTHCSCGRLWACLLPLLTGGEMPEGLSDICWELACAATYFQGGALEDAISLQDRMEAALREKAPEN